MDQIDRDIINGLQGGLEICERPYLEAAQRLGLQEEDLIWLVSFQNVSIASKSRRL